MSTSDPRPRVFISYTHDSPDHKNRVAQLKAQLWTDGIDCTYDGDVQSPSQGWPLWCEQQIEQADFVLVVCTETYLRRYKMEEEIGVGKGGTWEGYVIRQQLYDAAMSNDKFIPLIFSPGDSAHIPTPLRGVTQYNPTHRERYVALYALLTGQSQTLFPKRGPLREVPQHQIQKLFAEDPFELADGNPQSLVSSSVSTALTIEEGPVRFSFNEICEIIESLHEVVVDADRTSESQYDFRDKDIEEKNRINGVGAEYYHAALRRDEIYVRPIQQFLQHPANVHVKELYHEIVDELRRKIAALRPRYDSFEQLLLHIGDKAFQASGDRLSGSRRTMHVVLSFMYLNCDIGRKE